MAYGSYGGECWRTSRSVPFRLKNWRDDGGGVFLLVPFCIVVEPVEQSGCNVMLCARLVMANSVHRA